jgi:N utilization substance protein A
MEVPEIYEGIVEVKSISRDVGQRTKIAVYSKDEKVDCVGACVGMRGTRVKNIVSEIQGEKIDIIRYSSDIKEYIQAALSPAEISQIQINHEEKKANIIVADDQLSLAIGRNGQNVRLASQLVGWELNLFSFDQWKKLQDESEAEEKEEAAREAKKSDDTAKEFSPIESITPKILEALEGAGWDTLEKLSKATLEDLIQIKGLGKVKAQKIIDEVQAILNKEAGS